LHSLSLAALIAVVGMPFSDVEVVMFEIKALALIFISIILLIMGSNLLKERVHE
jgi:1,4-dihydroxy-2-naphthoate octaprenyltransferase